VVALALVVMAALEATVVARQVVVVAALTALAVVVEADTMLAAVSPVAVAGVE
jgi:hypothetical protein